VAESHFMALGGGHRTGAPESGGRSFAQHYLLGVSSYQREGLLTPMKREHGGTVSLARLGIVYRFDTLAGGLGPNVVAATSC
jgi:hypothetical protein